MILDFGDQTTEDVFNGEDTKAARRVPKAFWSVARRKLDMVNAAHELKDLRIPPGNRLERLKGNLSAYHCIRINDQFRVIFQWLGNNAKRVRIVDYHS
jgi:proteic killer suppression protein